MAATVIELTEDERRTLSAWTRAGSTEHRYAQRAQFVLAAARGDGTTTIARAFRVRPATVSKWRTRFAAHRVAGLQDDARPGAPVRYGAATEDRILALLDTAPPEGYARWNGRLVAEQLGDVSPSQVWRVLRQHQIQLERRRSWCVSTDPEFVPKAADIIGLYLHPPENAIVLSVDEKPSIQALERAHGYLRLPNGRAVSGYRHDDTRHGTTTLFAALTVATGQVKAGQYWRRRRREFLHFMNEVVADYPPEQELHVILDHLHTHKPTHDRWLARHPNVHLHDTPTHASWLNQVEVWFSLLVRAALRGARFTNPWGVRDAIDAFINVHNPKAAPFEWRKEVVHAVALQKRYSDLRK